MTPSVSPSAVSSELIAAPDSRITPPESGLVPKAISGAPIMRSTWPSPFTSPADEMLAPIAMSVSLSIFQDPERARQLVQPDVSRRRCRPASRLIASPRRRATYTASM